MSTCNRLDLQTLGSQPVRPKNLPDYWPGIPEGRSCNMHSAIECLASPMCSACLASQTTLPSSSSSYMIQKKSCTSSCDIVANLIQKDEAPLWSFRTGWTTIDANSGCQTCSYFASELTNTSPNKPILIIGVPLHKSIIIAEHWSDRVLLLHGKLDLR